MALKKWHKLPVNQRRSEGDRWNELVDEVNSNSDILENAVDNDTIYDDTDIKAKMGYSNIPNNTNLQEEIDAITVPTKVSDLDNDSGFLTSHQDITGKADSNHSHTLSNITDLTTVEAVITYEDESTETVLLVKKVVSDDP